MKKLMIRMIRFYKRNLSPLKPPCCKYYPTCSSYAIEAIEKRGAFVGFFLAAFRILRCNPFSKGGYDPVPEKGEPIRSRKKEPGAGDMLDAAERDRIVILPKTASAPRGENPFANENKTVPGAVLPRATDEQQERKV